MENFEEFQTLPGREITHRHLRKILNRFLKPFGARAVIERDKTLTGKPRSYLEVSGYFLPGKRSTSVTVTFHMPAKTKNVVFSVGETNRFLFFLSQVLQHELIHKNQWEQSNKGGEIRTVKVNHSARLSRKRVASIAYMSDIEEVESYAHDIVMEIMYHYPKENPYDVIKTIDKRRCLYSYSLFKRAFKGTDWTTLKKILLRKIYRWVPYTEIPKKVSVSC